MSARDEAVEVVAEVVADASCIGGDHIAKWPISMHGSTKPLPYCGRCFDAALVTAKDALEALSTAGFLATEQEWRVMGMSGFGGQYDNEAKARSVATIEGDTITTRRVTPWRSA